MWEGKKTTDDQHRHIQSETALTWLEENWYIVSMGGKRKEWKVLSSLICFKWDGRLGWNTAELGRDLAIDHRNVVMIFSFLNSDSESGWL